jgi:two-component sensor histidine kinase
VYESENLAMVDFSRYVRQLAQRLFRMDRNLSERARLRLDLAPVPVNLDTALPCGIIVNEAIYNSLQHGFPDGRTGEISIELREAGDGLALLTVLDDGIGLPSGMDWSTSQTLGFRLMRMLAQQVSASLDVMSVQGTEVQLRFAAGAPAVTE